MAELSVFFLLPAVLPCGTLTLLAAGADKLFAAYILQPHIIPLYAAAALLLFAAFHTLYFTATYLICKRAVV